jgi:hypothetical protein
MITLSLLAFASVMSLTAKAQDITLFSNWHLLPQQITTDIEQSLKLPQKDHLMALEELVLKSIALQKGPKKVTLLMEGCPSGLEVNEEFTTPFHGWTVGSLSALYKKDSLKFDHALTAIALKVEARLGNSVRTLCADNLELITLHQRAFSDLKGYIGFFTRLSELHQKKDEKTYERYEVALQETLGTPIKKKTGIEVARKKATDSLKKVRELIKKRNDSFIKLAKAAKGPVIIIIGGLHLHDLKNRLCQKNCTITTPPFYPKEDALLLDQLEEVLKVNSHTKK